MLFEMLFGTFRVPRIIENDIFHTMRKWVLLVYCGVCRIEIGSKLEWKKSAELCAPRGICSLLNAELFPIGFQKAAIIARRKLSTDDRLTLA